MTGHRLEGIVWWVTMVAVHSTMLPLGTTAPDFTLPDQSGELRSLDSIAEGASALVVAFISSHCPYVQHIAVALGQVATELAAVGVAVVGIGSNDVDSYPDDAPDRIAEAAGEWGWEFPCVFDADQSVAHAYRAACTPDFFVFDRNRRLVYRGQMDGARPSNDVAVTGEDLRAAALAAAAGSPPPEQQLPSLGCNIKWKSGNEPDWFR